MSKFWRVGFGRFGLIIFCRIAELLAVFALSGARFSLFSAVGISSLFFVQVARQTTEACLDISLSAGRALDLATATTCPKTR